MIEMEKRAPSHKHLEVKVEDGTFDDRTIVCPSSSEGSGELELGSKHNKVSFWGTTPLCIFCQAMFESWDVFLRNEGFCLPHYGSNAELTSSAEGGCTLCTQFIFMREPYWVEHKGKLGCPIDGSHPTLTGNSEDYEGAGGLWIRRTPESASDEPLPSKSSQGFVRLYIPGKGPGCAVEKTYRLELCQPRLNPPRLNTRLVSMVRVNDARDIISNSGISILKEDKVWSTQDAFHSCKEWMTKCQKEHSSCRVSLPFFLPTRLVSVRGRPRVVSLDDMKSIQNYATLSHCCKSITRTSSTTRIRIKAMSLGICIGGSQTFLTLSKSTLEDFGRQIPSDALSRTFLDAILVCQQLGVDYIWIDSLCIIQDDPQDWQKEAGLMSDVYGHSYINIVASGAVDGRAGLFFRRSGAWRCRVKVPLDGGPEIYECVPFNMHTESIRPMPLSNRGWAVQERLLPHRSLLFTATEVFWECNENMACERFPKSYPTELFSDYYSYSRGASRKQRVHEILWPEAVEQYSRCRLTFQRDKLVAISGVARQIQIHTRDQYVAGMWRSGLEQSLLWSTDVLDNDGKLSNSSENPPCKAPSWSWASVYNTASLPATQAPQHRLQVQVLDICIPPDEDPFGANSTARISLACSQMVMGHSSQDSSGTFYTDIFFGRKMLFRNIHLNFSQPNDIGRTLWLLPVLVNFEPVPFFEDDDITCSIRGLILRDGLGIEPGCYERIGFFVKEFEVSEHIRCRKDLDKLIEEWNAEAKGIGGRDFSFSRLHCDENGIMRKVITLI